MTGGTVVRNGTVVTPTGVVPGGQVVVAGDRIVGVDGANTTAGATTRIDATGRYVLPGLVDLHGDDLESHLFPRTNARVDTGRALSACERANLAAGVTTKFHAVAFEDDPAGDRSIECAREVVAAVDDREGPIDARVHARCELTDPASVAAVVAAAEAGVPDVVSTMVHVPGEGQFADDEAFARRYANGGAVEPAVERAAEHRRGVPDGTVDDRFAEVAAAARSAGAVLASHDDATAADVEAAHDHGASVCEYPVSTSAARRAGELGMTAAMGAPNLVRGGSLWDNLDARAAVDGGLVDVLCSDYHPPSLLDAVFVDTGEPLPARVARVSAAPAEAAGLDDRGRLEPGARADLLVVDPDPVPTVERVLVAGREVFELDADPD